MKVAVLGFGTVGKGVYEMIGNTPGLEQGPVLVLPSECCSGFMVTDIEDILNDGSVDAVAEAIGGTEPAGTFAEKVLRSGKHFITSNKAMVAERGIELSALARRMGKAFLFSAACGGGIPFLHNLAAAAKSDVILSIRGILNGTTNYILDLMQSEGASFEDSLRQAQELGYAEADPSADVSGTDSYRKILLACAVAYGIQPCGFSDIEGITAFTAADAEIIGSRGGTVKLIASGGRNEDGSVYASVEPHIFFDGMERGVRRNFNCVSYTGRNSGLITYFGQGAGRYPTASAVLRDITGIKEGNLYMLPEDCVRAAEVNSAEKTYLVRCSTGLTDRFSAREIWSENAGETVLVTGPVRTDEMHRLARQLRTEGREIFFASID